MYLGAMSVPAEIVEGHGNIRDDMDFLIFFFLAFSSLTHRVFDYSFRYPAIEQQLVR